MIKKAIEEQIKILKEGIRLDAPLVADFFDNHIPLEEYARSLYNYISPPEHLKRQVLFQKTVRELLSQSFTEAEIEKANIPWGQGWKINIVDHHGILNHPILIATNIIGNIHQLPSPQSRGIIVLSDSVTPFNNFFHKRGVQFKDKQLNIISHKDRHAIAYGSPVKKTISLVDVASKQGYATGELDFLARIENLWSKSASYPLVKNYLGQIQRLNFDLWPLLFEDSIRCYIPNLFYVSNEEVAARMLGYYLRENEHIFTKILCDARTRSKVLEIFNGVTGCWDMQRNTGSPFFWGLNQHSEAIRLKVEGEYLVGQESEWSLKIPFEPSAILEAIDRKNIFPGMFLVYGISIFHCGVKPLVGYGSMNYQTRMKECWLKLFETINRAEENNLIKSISTNGFIGGPKVTFGREQDAFKDLYALDVIYRGGLTAEYLNYLKKMPFNELLRSALIDIYTSYVSPEHKKEITITVADLMAESFNWIK